MIRRRRYRASIDRGSVTAELAVALPGLMLLLFFALGAVDAVMDKMRCIDAARDAALVTARGGDGVTIGGEEAPPGSTVTVLVVGGVVRATVSVPLRPLGAHLPTVLVTATSVAAVEPGASS